VEVADLGRHRPNDSVLRQVLNQLTFLEPFSSGDEDPLAGGDQSTK
jgi:hypothetical protein